MARELPSQVTLTNCNAYQVRIVRDGLEHSASFAINQHPSATEALAAAVAARDEMVARLGPSPHAPGGFRTSAQGNKRSINRVGVTRYFSTDRRRDGSQYLRFAVNWTDDEGYSRIKSFQVGRVGEFSWEDELHASLTAEAFRSEWEYSRMHKKPFDEGRYKNWKREAIYP